MSAYEYLKQRILDRHDKGEPAPLWKYVGPGYGQGLKHALAILEPYEAVTCSLGSGWLGSCEDFITQFEMA